MVNWRRGGSFVLSSVVAACVASLVVGLADGVFHTPSALHLLTTAGFISMLAVPLGLVGDLVVRLLWRSWRFDRLFASHREASGGSPLLASWILYLAVSTWLLAATAFNTVRILSGKTAARDVIALTGALAVVIAVVILVALSRPLVDLLAALLRRIDAVGHRRFGRTAFGPIALVIGATVVVLALVWLAWVVSVRPRLGDFDTGWVRYLITFVGVIGAVHAGWRFCVRRRRVAVAVVAGSVTATVAAITIGFYTRYQHPYAMLEVWGESRLAGEAIDWLYDIQSLRGELHLGEFRPAERPGASHPDVFLITIDTVRADHTPPYGGTADMPILGQIAREGALFDWAFSPGNTTRRSVPSIATGLSPTRVRGRVAGWALRLDPRHVLLAERLRAAGYDTAGFFCCGSHFGAVHRLGLIRGIDHVALKKDGMALAEMANTWLAARRASHPDRPLFVWMHFIEPHLWAEQYPASKHGSNVGRRYNLSLAAADRILGKVLTEVRATARRDHSIIIITSDHGEGVGDRGSRFHSTNLYNSQIHVPLVVLGPGITPRRIPETVGLVDLAPTILDLAGYVPPGMPQMDGVSLAPILRGEVEPRRDQGEAYSAMIADRSVERGMRALVVGTHKLIDNGDGYELYDLRRDPKERHDLSSEQPELLAEMKRQLAARHEIDAVAPF